jgi:putative tricarboxylic transport membrane protein
MHVRPHPRLGCLTRRSLLGTALASGVAVLASPAQSRIESIEIVVPAGPGGGWDQTARAMVRAFEQAGLASGVQVQNKNISGAELAQFVTSKRGQGNVILVGGLVMPDDITPLARLTGEYKFIVVPADSPIQTMQDLVDQLKQDPGSVSWGCRSSGGTDHILAGLIAKAAGVDPAKVNYIAHSGGGEALASILGGHVTVGVIGYEEFAPQVQAGKLRALALSSDERLPGSDVLTLKEQGIDVSLMNWRGVFAPPGTRDKDMEALSEAVDAMVKSPAWQETLKNRGWLDMYQPPRSSRCSSKMSRNELEGCCRSSVTLVKFQTVVKLLPRAADHALSSPN